MIEARRIGDVQSYPPDSVHVLYDYNIEKGIVYVSYQAPQELSCFGVTIDQFGKVYLFTRKNKKTGLLAVYTYTGTFIDTLEVPVDILHPCVNWKTGLDNNFYIMESNMQGLYLHQYTVTDE